jgi:hypothetical protein
MPFSWPMLTHCHAILFILLQLFPHLQPLIPHPCQLQKLWFFLHDDHKDVYYLIMIFN